ncbi:MAG: DUF2865 domain-containing protein [Pseudomonadota bacterium]
MRKNCSFRMAALALVAFHAGWFAAIPAGSAQGVFNNLFGWFTAPSAPKVQPARPGNDPYFLNQNSPQPQLSYPSSKYRTVCVRLCDGYYFPISNSSRRGKFHSDADQCQARCQGNTRLFYMPRRTADINQARDTSGKSYKLLENAFLYRKKYIPQCTCRPAPWSPEERARHAMYASPAPQVALNDQVLDKVASDVRQAEIAATAVDAENPYLVGGSGARAPDPFGPANHAAALRKKKKAKSKKLASAKKRRRRPANASGGVQGAGPKFLWPGDGG